MNSACTHDDSYGGRSSFFQMNVTESILQKIVPFLIRRTLGPLLDEEQKHNLNIGLPGNGRIVFRDIQFSPMELTKRMQAASAAAAGICVNQARVDALTVQISIFASNREPQLLVELSGLLVEVAPAGSVDYSSSKSVSSDDDVCRGGIPAGSSDDSNFDCNSQKFNKRLDDQESESLNADVEQSRISKWIQDSIASMHCRASHIEIRMLDASLKCAATLDIESILYQPDTDTSSDSLNFQTVVVAKTLSVAGLSINCLHGDVAGGRMRVLKSVGRCQVKSRAEYASSGKCVYTDVEIFTENLDFVLGEKSLKCLRQILLDMNEGAGVDFADTESDPGSRLINPESVEKSDRLTNLSHRPVNGGILVEESADDVSYLEAFYDATDQSISKFLSFVGPSSDSSDLTIKFHLLEISVKCCLGNNISRATLSEKKCHVLDEYVLLTISDANASATIATTRTIAHLEIAYCGIDAFLVDNGRTTVYPILRFTEVRQQLLI